MQDKDSVLLSPSEFNSNTFMINKNNDGRKLKIKIKNSHISSK